MGKIKVCMITTSYPRYDGDVRGIFIQKLVKNLENSNQVSVRVISPNKKYKNLLADAGLLQNLKSSFKAKLEFIPFLFEYFFSVIKESRKCDLIHANWIFSGIPGLLAKKIWKNPLLITIRGGEIHTIKPNGLISKLWKFILRRADIIVCVSKEIKIKLDKIIKIDTELIMNGIDSAVFKPMNKNKLRKELNLDKNKIILIYVGRLIKEKGPEMLLDAFSKIKNQKLELIFIGEGDIKDKLIKKNNEYAETKNSVSFLSNVKHELIPRYLAASDIFIFPSVYEAGGNTLLEAASCGLPIIGTNEGFVKDILNYKGVYLAEKNSDSIEKAIEKLIKDKKLREKLGKEARNKILEYGIGWKENSEEYIRLYKSLLKTN